MGYATISEKEYFQKYVTPLLNGDTNEPPEFEKFGQYVYNSHISPALGGASMAPHISAYVSRLEQIKKQGGFTGKMLISYEQKDLRTIGDGIGLNVENDRNGKVRVKAKNVDADSSVIFGEDSVTIGGVPLKVKKHAQQMKNLLTDIGRSRKR